MSTPEKTQATVEAYTLEDVQALVLGGQQLLLDPAARYDEARGATKRDTSAWHREHDPDYKGNITISMPQFYLNLSRRAIESVSSLDEFPVAGKEYFAFINPAMPDVELTHVSMWQRSIIGFRHEVGLRNALVADLYANPSKNPHGYAYTSGKPLNLDARSFDGRSSYVPPKAQELSHKLLAPIVELGKR